MSSLPRPVYLIQILLPLHTNSTKEPHPLEHYAEIQHELTERYGGLTAYTRAPAEGRWREGQLGTIEDEIVVYEVMVGSVDEDWWSAYRQALEGLFEQQSIIIRSQEVRLL